MIVTRNQSFAKTSSELAVVRVNGNISFFYRRDTCLGRPGLLISIPVGASSAVSALLGPGECIVHVSAWYWSGAEPVFAFTTGASCGADRGAKARAV